MQPPKEVTSQEEEDPFYNLIEEEMHQENTGLPSRLSSSRFPSRVLPASCGGSGYAMILVKLSRYFFLLKNKEIRTSEMTHSEAAGDTSPDVSRATREAA